MSDMDFMIHILNNLPDVYDMVLDSMENRLMLPDGDPNKLTIEDVRSKLNHRYDRINERSHADDDDDKEVDVAFYTKQFKGNCRNCVKYGHKAFECPEKKDGTLKCNYCGAQGHREFKGELKKAHQKALGNEKAKLVVEQSEDTEEFDELYINELGM